ncbi:MAG: fasciclin domain-containing protein [Geminicoccaceae bacterium]|nr:fasciclin domain-containing protein [Geminicoccaceae bacterium]
MRRSGTMRRFAIAAAVVLACGPAAAADIVETATASGQFTRLLQAARAAGLEPALRAPGPLTVFAPTDAAFEAMPPGTAERLMDPANKAVLAGVLGHHVLAGRLALADVAGKDADVKALNGQSLTVNGQNDEVTVNGAPVAKGDIQADNGVIHVIGRVLIPPTPVQPRM